MPIRRRRSLRQTDTSPDALTVETGEKKSPIASASEKCRSTSHQYAKHTH
jgi:hypothetical protein